MIGACETIATHANMVYVSSISIAEVTIKASLGKLEVLFKPMAMVEASGFESLDSRSEDSLLRQHIPFHHRDPFYRMPIAQSRAHQYPVVTDDRRFEAYDCRLVWRSGGSSEISGEAN